MKTHDYTNRWWGHDFFVSKVEDSGRRIEVGGWGPGLKAGDYLILVNGSLTESTRYRLVAVEYYSDPADMWKATADFAPRLNPTPIEQEPKP